MISTPFIQDTMLLQLKVCELEDVGGILLRIFRSEYLCLAPKDKRWKLDNNAFLELTVT